MVSDKNAELLGGVPLFHGLSSGQISAVVAKGEKEFFASGETIIKARSRFKAAYLILSGTVETRPSKKSGLQPETYDAGSLVGEMAMLTDTIAAIDVVATERVRALALSREALYKVMEEEPEIAFHLSDKITERLVLLAHDLRELDARLAVLELSADDTLLALAS
ncbi:MAG TPA: cyclic nucleotide-binding domain-containing protein [Hyphomicrobiales bacterium]|nr:cyclic nucleotide-binding domain-containing protein [Hyphomicrobiales bacterium]